MSIQLLEPAQQALDEAIAHQHRKPGYWRDRAEAITDMALFWNEIKSRSLVSAAPGLRGLFV